MRGLKTTVEHDVDADVTTIRAVGVLSPDNVAEMRQTLTACLEECPATIVVDVSSCAAASPSAITVFPSVLHRPARAPSVFLCLVDPDGAFLNDGGLAALGGVAAYHDHATARAAAEAGRTASRWVRRKLQRSLTAPGRARLIVSAACRDWGIAALSRKAELIVTELVTNALVHTSSPMSIDVRMRGGYLLLRVRDGSSARPVVASWPVTDREVPDRGRGLSIVERLSAAWGYILSSRGDGKVVWATLRADKPQLAG